VGSGSRRITLPESSSGKNGNGVTDDIRVLKHQTEKSEGRGKTVTEAITRVERKLFTLREHKGKGVRSRAKNGRTKQGRRQGFSGGDLKKTPIQVANCLSNRLEK